MLQSKIYLENLKFSVLTGVRVSAILTLTVSQIVIFSCMLNIKVHQKCTYKIQKNGFETNNSNG